MACVCGGLEGGLEEGEMICLRLLFYLLFFCLCVAHFIWRRVLFSRLPFSLYVCVNLSVCVCFSCDVRVCRVPCVRVCVSRFLL